MVISRNSTRLESALRRRAFLPQLTLRDFLQTAHYIYHLRRMAGGDHAIDALQLLFAQGLPLQWPEDFQSELKEIVARLLDEQTPPVISSPVSLVGDRLALDNAPQALEFHRSHWRLPAFVGLCSKTRRPGLVIGPSRIGKAAGLEAMWHGRVTQVQLHSSSTAEDLIGSVDFGEGTPCVAWRDGPAIQAMRDGHMLVLRGLDEAPRILAPILTTLCTALQFRQTIVDGRLMQVSPNFSLFATARSRPKDTRCGEVAGRFMWLELGTVVPKIGDEDPDRLCEIFVGAADKDRNNKQS